MILQTAKRITGTTKDILTVNDMPELKFTHIRNLTDDTGIIQHALFSIPNRKEGYCIDDCARALMFCVWACREKENRPDLLPLMQVYISFIHYMQTPDGEFKNFMSYTKEAIEERGSEDSFGRTIMALGYLANEGSSNMLTKAGAGIFSHAYSHIFKLVSIRGIANSIVGLCQYIKYNYPDYEKEKLVIALANKMVSKYQLNKSGKWHWFEPILTYDNAILPLALLNAYEITSDDKYLNIAVEAMEFLESQVWHKGIFRPIGNDGWQQQGKVAAKFDQQGVDTMAMVMLYQQAYRVTREDLYKHQMYQCYQWFLGKNDLGVSLYDPETGGCADGLHSKGINLNQGAESTLAYWISHLAVAAALQE